MIRLYNLGFKKIIEYGIYLIVFLIPAYIFSFKIWFIPTNFLELLIGALFIFWFFLNFKKLPKIAKNIFRNPLFLPIFFIFLGITLSAVFSVDIKISAGIWKGWFVVPLMFFVVIASEIRGKKQVKNIIISLTLSGFFVSLIALYYWLNNNLTYDGRLSAFYLSPNYLAMYLSPILILSLYLYSVFDKKILKFLLFIVHCSLFAVLYLTYSYGAWAGLVAALLFVVVIMRHYRLKQKSAFYLFGVFFLLVVLLFFSQTNSQKFQGLLNFSYPSLSSRLVIWQSSLEIIKDHSLNGIGPGLFQKYYLDEQTKSEPYPEWAVPQPHNLFLAFWLQAGLIGLFGFLWLLIRFFKNGLKALFAVRCSLFVVLLMAAMVYIITHGLTDTTYWKNDLSIIFWLIIALNYKAVRFSC